jgi:hypothetical protein
MNRRSFLQKLGLTGTLLPLIAILNPFISDAKTTQVLDIKSSLGELNHRNIITRIKKDIEQCGEHFIGERNNQYTRNMLSDMIKIRLDYYRSLGFLFDYTIIVDETINPPSLIDANAIAGKLYLQTTNSINWVIIDFTIT